MTFNLFWNDSKEQGQHERQINTFFNIKHILSILTALIILIPATSAKEDSVAWNITQTTQNAVSIGNTLHIDQISWWVLFGVGILFLLISLKWSLENGTDLLSGMGAVIFGFLTLTGFTVQSWSYDTALIQLNETAQISIIPVYYTQPAWICFITFMLLIVCVVNVYRIHLLGLVESADKFNMDKIRRDRI